MRKSNWIIAAVLLLASVAFIWIWHALQFDLVDNPCLLYTSPVIEADECIGCGICVDACPQEVLEVVNGVADAVNEEACIACGDCVEECPMGAIPEIVED